MEKHFNLADLGERKIALKQLQKIEAEICYNNFRLGTPIDRNFTEQSGLLPFV